MNQIIDYENNILICKEECLGCAYTGGKFVLPCGIAYEDKICVVSQDWELPINGMIIITPKRHVVLFEELTKKERAHIFDITNKVVGVLRKYNVAKEFNVLFEEKKDRHFHIWILPRDDWKERGIDPTKDIRELKKYALENLKTKENFDKIKETTKIIKNEMYKKRKIF